MSPPVTIPRRLICGRFPDLFKPGAHAARHHRDGVSQQPTITILKKGFTVVGYGGGIDFENAAAVREIWERLFEEFKKAKSTPPPADVRLFGIAQSDHPLIPRTAEQCLAYMGGVNNPALLHRAETDRFCGCALCCQRPVSNDNADFPTGC